MDTELVKDAAETIVDEVVIEVFKKRPVIISGVAGVILGAAVGTYIAKKYLYQRYERIANEEMEKVRDHYSRILKDGEYATPEKAAEKLLGSDAVTISVVDGSPSVEVVERIQYYKGGTDNIFTSSALPADATVVNPTDPKKPYVISVFEFNEGAPGQQQETVTYYEGDQTVADTADEVMDNVDLDLGNLNLTRFGDNSDDSNIVYIRNERIGIDYEVIRSFGKYSVEVSGIDDTEHLAHAEPMRRRRVREF